MKNPIYNLSDDYETLASLLEQGYEIPCYYLERGYLKDIQRLGIGKKYHLGPYRVYNLQGEEWIEGTTREEFIGACKIHNVKFITTK